MDSVCHFIPLRSGGPNKNTRILPTRWPIQGKRSSGRRTFAACLHLDPVLCRIESGDVGSRTPVLKSYKLATTCVSRALFSSPGTPREGAWTLCPPILAPIMADRFLGHIPVNDQSLEYGHPLVHGLGGSLGRESERLLVSRYYFVRFYEASDTSTRNSFFTYFSRNQFIPVHTGYRAAPAPENSPVPLSKFPQIYLIPKGLKVWARPSALTSLPSLCTRLFVWRKRLARP